MVVEMGRWKDFISLRLRWREARDYRLKAVRELLV
jgi:hypothetical protein